jgi:hypothetical protein
MFYTKEQENERTEVLAWSREESLSVLATVNPTNLPASAGEPTV